MKRYFRQGAGLLESLYTLQHFVTISPKFLPAKVVWNHMNIKDVFTFRSGKSKIHNLVLVWAGSASVDSSHQRETERQIQLMGCFCLWCPEQAALLDTHRHTSYPHEPAGLTSAWLEQIHTVTERANGGHTHRATITGGVILATYAQLLHYILHLFGCHAVGFFLG